MPHRARETVERAKRNQHFKDIEASLSSATKQVEQNRCELERSHRILSDGRARNQKPHGEAKPDPQLSPKYDDDGGLR
jgi:hypothetical protein